MRILLLFALLFSSYVFGQLSDKHWLPPLHSRNASNVGEHVIYLSTPEIAPFQVTVTNGNGLAIGTYTISAGNPTQFTVGNGQPSNMFVTQADLHTVSGNTGLILSGLKNFYVTFKVRATAHGEIFVSKGRDGIGTDFRLGISPQISDDSNRNFISSFMATENNTTVTVSDYDIGVAFVTPVGINSNGSQTFNLQAGQSVVLSGYSNVSANLNGFIGARLTSNKPVAVTTGNFTANPAALSGGNDICLDQIVPIEKIGMEYIVVKGNGTSQTELPIVVATENNTQIFVNGNMTSIATINAGDYYIVPFSYFQGVNNQNMYIRSDKPVYLYQILAGDMANHTIGMNFIPPLSCSYPKVVDLIPSINSLGTLSNLSADIFLVTASGSVISINGNPITVSPEAVLGNQNWETYRIPDYAGNVKVESTGPTAVGVLGLSGTIGVASFYSGFKTVNLSYPAGVGIEDTDMTIANGLALCPGQTTVLNTNLSLNDYSFEWTLDGNVIAGATDPSLTITGSGTYCVNLSSSLSSSCSQSDCIVIENFPSFTINNDPDDLFSCDNNFDLNQNTASVLNGLDPFVYDILFFSSMQDAINLTNQISSLQTTTGSITTFYVRVENFLTGCFQITQFDAITWSCNSTTPPNIMVCDDISGDGVEIFDLTVQNAIVLNGLDPNLYTISYFNLYTDAIANINSISNISTYSGGPDETIFVRIQSNSNPSEFYFTKFDLIVLPVPNAVLSVSAVCEGSNGTVTITGTPNAVVQYSVDNGSNQTVALDASGNATITTPVLTSDSVYCLIDVTTTCSTVPLTQCETVVLNSSLIVISPSDLIIYENPYNGYATFNLTSNESNILNGIDPLTVSFQYFQTLAAASAGLNPILNPTAYTNSTIPETIYVKVIDNSTSCSSITSFGLVVIDSSDLVYIPDANFKAKLIQLGVDTNNDSEIQFTEALVPTTLNVSNSNIADLTGIEAFENLTTLDCSSNSLTTLNCSYNFHLTSLYFAFNSLLETVFIKNGSDESSNLNSNDWSGNFLSVNNPSLTLVCVDQNQITNIQSLVSATVNVNSYCIINPGGNYNTISGIIQYDFNANGCDVLDSAASYMNLSVSLNSVALNSSIFTNLSGNYSYTSNQNGLFGLTPNVENPTYFTVSPNPANINLPVVNNSTTLQDFCIVANGVHPDLEIVIAPITTARPGFDAIYQIVYKNKGNQTLTGNLQFTYNDTVLDYISSSILPDSQSTGNISWDYTNLKPFEIRYLTTTLNVNSPTEIPAVNIGDVLDFSVTINPITGDETISDNTFVYNQTVVGSYDPNDKTCLEGEIVSPSKIGDYLHYNINFENTGTAHATFIVVKDMIDVTKFDINTLQILNASHSMTTRVNDNKIEFIFENINLVPNGKGNVTFKIKTFSTLAIGSSVTNKADIYFDYNFPIETNTATSIFQVLSNSILNQDDSAGVYPNPSKDMLNIKSNSIIKSIEIYDVNGRIVQSKISNLETESFDISNFTKGIYFVKIKTEFGEKLEKIIKE